VLDSALYGGTRTVRRVILASVEHPVPLPALASQYLGWFFFRGERYMSRIFKNLSSNVEMVIFAVLGLICLAGIIRFIILADIF
jgi:hypothetical protein